MKVSTLISLAFSISLVACSSSPTKTVLEERAGYDVKGPPLGCLGASGGVKYVPTRVPEKVVVGWLFPHDMTSKVYFWGSWLSVVVEDESWAMVKVDVPKADKKSKRTADRPKVSPPKKSKTPPKPTLPSA
jgi:hypothetical protein